VYPTGKADIRFTFPDMSEEEEELRLLFNWQPAYMSTLAAQFTKTDDEVAKTNQAPVVADPGTLGIPPVELLMYAIPHHQERIRPTLESSNIVHSVGCMPTIHGTACPVCIYSSLKF
jgi:hypothetical protein